MRRRPAALAAALAVGLALAGCSSPARTAMPTPAKPEPMLAPEVLAESAELQRLDYEALLLETVTDAEIPAVRMVRPVLFREIAQAHAACLQKRGWDVAVSRDGVGTERTSSAGEDPTAYRLDEYRCAVQYPLHVEYAVDGAP